MRKSMIIVAALAAMSVSVAVVATAGAGTPGNNVSTITGNFLPNNPGATVTKGGMFVEATTLDGGDPGTPTAPAGPQPEPTTMVRLHIDDDINILDDGIPVCSASLAGTTTQAAMLACGNASVGGGVSTLCVNDTLGGCVVYQAAVSAFNGGRDGNNRQRILLHGRNDETGITVVLTGTVKQSTVGPDFNRMLEVPVPLVAGGAASITDFSVNVNNAAFIRAKCTDADNLWHYRAQFVYSGAEPNDIATDTQACT